MGRGDKKTRKGKIKMGSYGVTRPRDKKVVVAVSTKEKVAKGDATAPKVAAKKAAPKKEAAEKKVAPKKAAAKKAE
jgi:ribosomal small subunit protein bTHX